MIIIAGGDADPNIALLAGRLAARYMPHLMLCVGTSSLPHLTWSLADDRLQVNGVEVRPSAFFLRHDVFTYLADRQPASWTRASRWYQTLMSWVLAHEDVAFLNRGHGTRYASKPHILHLARRLGLATPESLVTNDLQVLEAADGAEWVIKPVNGGEYTRLLADARVDEAWRGRCAAAPAIIQHRLVGPELRIYRVGERWFAFSLQSEALDYRATADVVIGTLPAPDSLTVPLGRLMDQLGLDFGAADFKACPETGRQLFLEVNSAPMFAAFDRVARGALSDAILDWLATGQHGAAIDATPYSGEQPLNSAGSLSV
jgi:hypothetical protein